MQKLSLGSSCVRSRSSSSSSSSSTSSSSISSNSSSVSRRSSSSYSNSSSRCIARGEYSSVTHIAPDSTPKLIDMELLVPRKIQGAQYKAGYVFKKAVAMNGAYYIAVGFRSCDKFTKEEVKVTHIYQGTTYELERKISDFGMGS